eukprot:m.47912 g.47912  ORF g.47912 m.47912 type:complete len:68 (+) comp47639_c0_seq1:1-204(+)
MVSLNFTHMTQSRTNTNAVLPQESVSSATTAASAVESLPTGTEASDPAAGSVTSVAAFCTSADAELE